MYKKINFDKFFSISKIKSFIELYYYIQTSLISNGTKLEKQIQLAIEIKSKERGDIFVINDLNIFFDNINKQKDGKYIVFTKEILKSRYSTYDNFNKKINTDCFIIEKNKNNLSFSVVELKSGCELDTKKTKAEKDKLYLTIDKLKEKFKNIDYFNIDYKILLISFFEKNKEVIYHGLKKEFNMDEILTGEEFCLFFDISFYDLLELKIPKKIKKNEVEIINPELFFTKKILKELKETKNIEIQNYLKEFCINYLKTENKFN